MSKENENKINEEEHNALLRRETTINEGKNIVLMKRNKFSTLFEPNSPLLHNKIVNTFSSLDKVPQKYQIHTDP